MNSKEVKAMSMDTNGGERMQKKDDILEDRNSKAIELFRIRESACIPKGTEEGVRRIENEK